MSQTSEFESTIETVTPQQRERARALQKGARRLLLRRRATAVGLILSGGLLIVWALFPTHGW